MIFFFFKLREWFAQGVLFIVVREKNKQDQKPTQIGLHSVSNFLGRKKNREMFETQHEKFCKEYGIKIRDNIQRFGIDITDIQMRVVEGILQGFSQTDYKGNIAPKDKIQLAKERFSGKVPDTYKYIDEIPRIRVSQTEVLKWAGIKKNSIAGKERALKALQDLGVHQYCFYYDRLAKDSRGEPVRDRKGYWKKESVVAVDSLFMVKEIRDEKTDAFQYYEIEPSSIFLDQRESYFLLIPYNWREEVRSIVGKKKASSYTFRFLLFLRYQYEMKRRSPNCTSPYQVKWSSEEVAIAINMPESVYRRKKDRMNKILEDAYSVAKTLGYLSDYDRKSDLDILTLNDEKYHLGCSRSGDSFVPSSKKPESSLKQEEHLFNLFHRQRSVFDLNHYKPEGKEKEEELLQFSLLLKDRSLLEIEKVIYWGIPRKYWCVRLLTPEKLRKNFLEAFTEMIASENEKNRPAKNKNKAKLLLEKIIKKDPSIRIEVLNRHIEFLGESGQPTVISYESKNFDQELQHAFSKWRILLSE